MITASIRFLTNNLLADLSCKERELYDNLQSIGVLTPPSLIKLDNARTLQITLTPTDQTGELVHTIIDTKNDTLGKVNRLCRTVFCMDFRDEDAFSDGIKKGKIKSIDQGLKVAERLKSNREQLIRR